MQCKLEEAENHCRLSIEINSKNEKALSNLRNILNKKGRFKEAEIYYSKALELYQKTTTSAFYFPLILDYKRETLDETEMKFRKAIQYNELNSMKHCKLGALCLKKDNQDDAIYHFKKALEFDGTNNEAYNSLNKLVEKIKKSKKSKGDI